MISRQHPLPSPAQREAAARLLETFGPRDAAARANVSTQSLFRVARGGEPTRYTTLLAIDRAAEGAGVLLPAEEREPGTWAHCLTCNLDKPRSEFPPMSARMGDFRPRTICYECDLARSRSRDRKAEAAIRANGTAEAPAPRLSQVLLELAAWAEDLELRAGIDQ